MPSFRKPDCGHTTLKVLVVIYNIFFWLVGTTILAVGIYAEIEKRNYEAVSDVLLNPATVLIVLGSFMFILTFIGGVGALRENITLLKIFIGCLVTYRYRNQKDPRANPNAFL